VIFALTPCEKKKVTHRGDTGESRPLARIYKQIKVQSTESGPAKRKRVSTTIQPEGKEGKRPEKKKGGGFFYSKGWREGGNRRSDASVEKKGGSLGALTLDSQEKKKKISLQKQKREICAFGAKKRNSPGRQPISKTCVLTDDLPYLHLLKEVDRHLERWRRVYGKKRCG